MSQANTSRGTPVAAAVEAVRGNAASLSSIAELRRRARQSPDEGAVTPSYSADKQCVLRLLNEALATELGLTRERVRQVQVEALTRLRTTLKRRGVSKDALL